MTRSRILFFILVGMPLSCSLLLVALGCGLPNSYAASIVPDPGAVTALDPTGANIFNVKLAPYSAKGDGITDDTLAIRTAISAACTAGGGEVWFPRGTYTISPQSSNETAALTVSCDNITLAGAGMGTSILSRKTLGDTDPDKTCPVNSGYVNRGSGIFVTHKSDGDKLRHSFHMQDLSLLGNRKAYTGQKGGGAWPATQSNCFNVWDISDKGLFVDWDATDIQVLRTEIAYFSGELFYSGGGTNSVRWLISASNIHHSNGDAISVSAGIDILNSQLHDVATDGIENMPFAGQPQFISGNTISNIGLDGINVLQTDPVAYNATTPSLEIASNTVTSALRYGVVMLSRGGSIHDNQIYDSALPGRYATGIGVIGMQLSNGSWLIPQNITIENNTVLAKTVNTQGAIEVYTAAGAGVTASNISVTHNTYGPMKPARAGNVYMLSGIFVMDGTQNVTVQSNTPE